MKYTPNYNLKKPEGTDTVNIDDFNNNADILDTEINLINEQIDTITAQDDSFREQINNLEADYIRSPGYGVTTGSANTYALTLNPALAAYTAGVCVAVKINVANKGASTININGLGAKPIKDSKGNALTSGKLALNGVYTLRYDGSNFILQGEGGEYGTATVSDVLSGKTIGTDNGIVEGTIPSKAAATITPSTIAQTIAAGQYLSGIQTILGDTDLVSSNIKSGANIFGVSGNANIVDTSAGDATSAQILSGKKAYVDGALVTGTIPSKGAQMYTPGTTNQTITSGQYLSGAQTISGSANFIESNIKKDVNLFGKIGTYITPIEVIASDVLRKSQGNYYSGTNTANTVYELRFAYRVEVSGSIRVSFDMKKSSIGNTGYCYGRIYKNGIAIGIERSNRITEYNTYTEDITVSPDDIIQLYGRGQYKDEGYYLANFNIYFDTQRIDSSIVIL